MEITSYMDAPGTDMPAAFSASFPGYNTYALRAHLPTPPSLLSRWASDGATSPAHLSHQPSETPATVWESLWYYSQTKYIPGPSNQEAPWRY